MSVPIKVDLLPKNKRPGYAMKPEYITIHDTGNASKGADAKAHNKYVHNVAPNPSWHFTVDDHEIYQHLPTDTNGWHAGDGVNGVGNRKSIGIEICMNADGNRAQAEANAAWLCAKLIKEIPTLKPFPACMKQHYDWSKKNCPAQIRGRKNGWANFLAAIEAHLKPAVSPKPDRTIGIYVNGKKVSEVGYLIGNATYVRAAYVVELAGGKVTGHGDHIKVTLPKDSETVQKLQSQITALKADVDKLKSKLNQIKSIASS